MPELPREKGGITATLRELGPYIGVGWSMAVGLLLSLGAGFWLDRKLGTRPILFLVGAVFGMGAAAWQLYKAYTMMTSRK